VTSAAQGPVGEPAQVESVRLMAGRTRHLARMECSLRPSFIVAFRALSSDRRSPLGMRIVASETVSFVLRMMCRRHVVVTAFASLVSCRSHRMGFVTTAAITVLRRLVLCQDPRSLMTRGTPKRTRCRKRMRLMAARARIMSTAECRGRRHRWLLCSVTLHAGRRIGGELVPSMAVRT